MQHNGWDHALTVSAGGTGLVGHAGAVLLRKAMRTMTGLTGNVLGGACGRRARRRCLTGESWSRRSRRRSLNCTSMSDIALLAHLAPVLGAAPSGPTVRRALELAGAPAMLDRIARARAREPGTAHAWDADRRSRHRVPVAGDRGEDPVGLGRHRHGRHPGHRQLGQGRGSPHLEEGLRLPPFGSLVPQYPRVPGHEAQARQRRLEHLHRPPGGAGRGPEAGPVPVPAQGHGPRRRRRRQPRPHRPPAVPELESEEGAVHDRVDDHRSRRGRHRRRRSRSRRAEARRTARTAAPRRTRTPPRSPA